MFMNSYMYYYVVYIFICVAGVPVPRGWVRVIVLGTVPASPKLGQGLFKRFLKSPSMSPSTGNLWPKNQKLRLVWGPRPPILGTSSPNFGDSEETSFTENL